MHAPLSASPTVSLGPAASVDLCAPWETPVGRCFVAFDGPVVSAVGRTPAGVEASVRARFARPVRRVAALPQPLAQALAAHLQGAPQDGHENDYDDGQLAGPPALRFDLGGLPALDQAVLRAALAIPRGEVRTYGQLARQIGQPQAAKEVGQALALNPIPLLIPCHRVVYADGRLGGYIFGSRAKHALLRAEGVQLGMPGRVA
jgi:O-6-methylguanine DNA methyltransferase